MGYFLKSLTNKCKLDVELNLSNHATKPNLKNSTGVETSQLAEKR